MTDTVRYSIQDLRDVPHGHPDYNQYHARHKHGLGSWVTTPLGQRGRVTDVHYGCPESDAWKAGLSLRAAAEADENTRWLTLLVQNGGAVVYPDFLLTTIPPIPAKEMRNNSYNFYFGHEESESA